MTARKLSPELHQISISENNEVPDQVQKEIQHFKDWLKFQKHLTPRTDDQFLLNILRLCKFKLYKAHDMIDKIYSLQAAVPEFSSNRDVNLKEIQEILKSGIILPLRHLASDQAPRTIIIRCAPVDLTKYTPEALAKIVIMFLDLFFDQDDNCIIAGIEVVADISGLTMKHLMVAIPFFNTYRKYIRPVQKIFKFKPCGYYLLNINSFFETIYNMVSPLIKEKHTSKIKFFSTINCDEFKKTAPMSIMPKEYGGDGDTIEELTEYWKKTMTEKREWFLEQEKFCSDESLRVEKVSYFEEHSGVQGSFTKLDID